jgi:N-acetylmuramoyl-L-alanine amidase
MTQRTSTDFIAVHCSATKPSMDWGEDQIRASHLAQGWEDIGYNCVIKRDGTIQIGKHPDDVGAHVKGFNHRSLGICLIGGLDEDGKATTLVTDYPQVQIDALLLALRFWKRYAPGAYIQGHRDFPKVAKDCPCFDVREWLGEVAPELL